MKRAIVFGGSGFIGKYLTEELVNRNYKVRVADISTDGVFPNDVEYFQCDILNRDQISNVFDGFSPDVVYNLAGFANLDLAIDHPVKTFELNVVGNLNILEETKSYPEAKFVFASSAYAMSTKGSFYGISKLSSEKVVEEYGKRYGLKYIILRYGSIYSEVKFSNNYIYNLIEQVSKTGTIIHKGDGEEFREYIHAIDASKLSVDVIEDDAFLGKHIILTGNEKMKRIDLFKMIQEILGDKKVQIQLNTETENHHYQTTPYSFNPTVCKKLSANPHIDMGQGILECIQSVYQSEE